MGSVMMDILKTNVDDVDNFILAKGVKSNDTEFPVVKKRNVKSNDTEFPVVKKRKINQDKIDDDNTDGRQTVPKKLKKKQKIEKVKHKKKSEKVNINTSDVVDDYGKEMYASDAEECSGLADVMSKILNKKVKTPNVILAKCETDKQRVLKTTTKVKSSTNEQLTKSGGKTLSSEHERILKRREWDQMGRLKPSVLEKDREKNLQRIATKGVVQLFNAVHKQQALLEVKIKDAGATESKRERAVHSLTKGHFLDMLKTTKLYADCIITVIPLSVCRQNEHTSVDVKLEPVDADSVADAAPTWSVLRDDFMAGASMKDWDKQEDDSD